MSAYLVKRLQSVLNALARLICGLSDSTMSPKLWCRCIGCASQSSNQIGCLGPLSSTRQRPRLLRTFHSAVQRSKLIVTAFCNISSSTRLLIPPVRRSNVNARAFPVPGPALRNSLQADITSIDNLPVFRRRLNNYMFLHSYPGAVQ